jgi:DNA-binding PadR family transcriptional regulator
VAPKKRKVDNLLALAVLSTLYQRPMHRYEMASILKSRGKDQQLDLKWGSFYTVVRNMEKHGFLTAIGNTREGGRPERVVYQITEAGKQEMLDWTRELLRTATPEHPKFEAGLSLLVTVPPGEAADLLTARLDQLRRRIDTERTTLTETRAEVPRLFLVENEFSLAMLEAEAEWVAALLTELTNRTFDDIDGWQTYHDTGHPPPEIADQAERGAAD